MILVENIPNGDASVKSGSRVRRLRIAAGLSQADLALRAGQATGSISMLENGRLAADQNLLSSVARVFGASVEYLSSVTDEPISTKPWLRAYADASKKTVDRAIADSELAIEMISSLKIKQIPDTLPVFSADLSDDEAIEAFASEVRETAGLSTDAAVPNVIRTAEKLGCVVLPLDDEIGRHLGLSFRVDGVPVIRVAKGSLDPEKSVPGDRQRFTTAHELGHLGLHSSTPAPNSPEESASVEKQAHRFAGAFLAPGDALLSDLEGLGGRVTLKNLAHLKSLWGISIKALVVRLRQLGVIGEEQSRSLYKQISARKWNKSEPIVVDLEAAVWFERKYARLRASATYERTDLGGFILPDRYFESWADWEPTADRGSSAVVVPFPVRTAIS